MARKNQACLILLQNAKQFEGMKYFTHSHGSELRVFNLIYKDNFEQNVIFELFLLGAFGFIKSHDVGTSARR